MAFGQPYREFAPIAETESFSSRAGLRIAGNSRAPAPSSTQLWRYMDKISRYYGEVYSSDEESQASGAASSNRVYRLMNTKFRLPVGPLRCFAMIKFVFARSSSGASDL